MSRKDDEKPQDEPTQKTPTGVEIPVPTRDEFLRDLRKVAGRGTVQRSEEEASTKSASREGHYSLWGDPDDLLGQVTRVSQYDEPDS